jgi:uncharacterized LabA/DUF88 family protein
MKTAVFIDGNNVFHSARQLGFEVDYAKLLHTLLKPGDVLVKAIFYTGVDDGAEKQRGFLTWMRRNGFKVVTKPVKVEDNQRRAHLEVEIATDLLLIGSQVEKAILVSGDEDFAYPVKALSDRLTRVEIASFKSSTANRLLDAADEISFLDDLSDNFRKDRDDSKPRRELKGEGRDPRDVDEEDFTTVSTGMRL